MATKTGNWLMAIGVFIAFVGLCFLPAGFGADADRTMLGAGAMVIAIGVLLIAAGFYVKARVLGTVTASATAPANAKRPRSKSNCDQCGQDEPVIQCRVHQIHLCTTCLGKHYDFRSCAYVPSTRRGAPAKSAAAAYSQTTSG
jgi:ribosomal protein S14